MSGRILALTTAVLLGWDTVVTAEPPGPLDLIPEDALAGIAVRNVDDFIKKGDKFIDAGGFGKDFLPSQIFTDMYALHGIKDAVDQHASAAILLADSKLIGSPAGDNGGGDFAGLTRLVVFVVPFKDADKIGQCFEIKKGALQPGKVVEGKSKDEFCRYFTVRGKHLIYGKDEKVVAAVAKAKPTGSALAADRRKALNEADGVLHVNNFVWYLLNGEGMKQQLVRDAGADEQKAADELIQGIGGLNYALVALHIGDGLGLSLVTVFPKDKSEATKKLLTTLAAGPGASDLNGLPEGRVVAAQAIRGDGSQNAAVVKVFFNLFFKQFAQTKLLLSASERTNFAGVFAEVWQRLKGSRFAIYQNADETKHGRFSVVAILDTNDADKFLKDMRELGHFADESFDLSAKNPRKEDVATVEQLIRDLGSDKYEVRESASTKLGIIGDAALPYLEKALKSDDAEVSRRAQALKLSIEESALLRRKELLVQEAIPHVRPTFVFVPKAETADGHKIDVVGVKLADKEFAAAKQFAGLFGPEWNKIRLAVHGKQVIVLLGSDQHLLKATLKNVKDGNTGLGGTKHLAAFAKQADPARKVEFHASLQSLTAETDDELKALKGENAKASLTSFALTVDADRLQLDVWIPIGEAKVIANKGGWR